MKYKLISSCALLIIVYYSFTNENIATANHQPSFYASVQTMNDEIVKGLLLQLEDSLVILYPGTRKEFSKGLKLDPVVIAWSKIKQIELGKKDGLSKDLPIDGAIGFASAFSREIEPYAGVFSFPIAIITRALAGNTSGKKYTINGNYTAFNKIKKGYNSFFKY